MNKDDDDISGILSCNLSAPGKCPEDSKSDFTLPPPTLNSGGLFFVLMLTIIDLFLGNWSGIKATFTFERMASYFFIHVYGPCALIVIISWVSFLLPRSSPPARVTLGVTSVLTVVTILNMLNNSMPKVL